MATTLALPAAPASRSVLIVNANEYLDARAGFAGDARSVEEFIRAEAAGLVKWMAGSHGRVHIDPAAADVMFRVREFQERQSRLATIFPVPSLKIS